MKTVTYFLSLGSKIKADGDCSYEIKKCLLPGRTAMTNLYSVLKSRDANKGVCSKLWFFQQSCESWTIKKAESRRIHTFELW